MSVSSGGKKNYKSCLELTLRRIRRFEFSTNHPDPADERNELLSRPLSFCFSLAAAVAVVVVLAAAAAYLISRSLSAEPCWKCFLFLDKISLFRGSRST